jgi:hypothetical protein
LAQVSAPQLAASQTAPLQPAVASAPVVGGVQQFFSSAASLFQPQPTVRTNSANTQNYVFGRNYQPSYIYPSSSPPTYSQTYASSASYPNSAIYPPAVTFNPYARTVTASSAYYPPTYPPVYPPAYAPAYLPALPPGYAPGYTLPYTSTYNPFLGSYPYLPPYPVAGTNPYSSNANSTTPTQYTYVGGVLHSSSQPGYTVPFPASVTSYALPNVYGPLVDIYGSRYPYASVYINGVWYKPWEVPAELGGYPRSSYNPYDPGYLRAYAEPGFGYRNLYLPGVDIYGSSYPYAPVYLNGVWYRPWEIPGRSNFGGTYSYNPYAYNPYAGTDPYLAPYEPYRSSYPYDGSYNPYRSNYPYASSYPYNSGYDPYASGYLHTYSDTRNGLRVPTLTRNLAFQPPLPAASAFALPTYLTNGWPQRPETGLLGYPSQVEYPSSVRLPVLGAFRLPSGIAAALPPAFGFDRFFAQAPLRTELARLPLPAEPALPPAFPPGAPALALSQITGQFTGQISGQFTGQITGQFTGQITGQPAAAAPALAQPLASANPVPMSAGMFGAGLFQPSPALAAPSAESLDTSTPSIGMVGAPMSGGDLTIATAPGAASVVIPAQQIRSLGPSQPSGVAALPLEAVPASVESASGVAALPPQTEVAAVAASLPVELPASSVAVLDPNAAVASVAALPATGAPVAAAGGLPIGSPLVAILAVLTGLGLWALSFVRPRGR